MVGSEVYSSEVKKTAVLMEHFRRAIGATRLFNLFSGTAECCPVSSLCFWHLKILL